ncbi:MAG TPA: histidine kinase [Flavipsychrobacter sp.]|nr:histidine kinase [Flavipsychrobacter sp.]
MNKSYFGYLLALVLFYGNSRTIAQVPGMRKYAQLDGYTATKGYEIEQDEKGNILLGTDNGGMIFDGKKFRTLLNTHKTFDAEILYVRPLGDSRILLLPLTGNASYLDKGKLVTVADDQRLLRSQTSDNRSWKDPVTGDWWLFGDYLDRVCRFHNKEITVYRAKELEDFSDLMVINNQLHGNNKKREFYRYNPETHVLQKMYQENGQVFNFTREGIPLHSSCYGYFLGWRFNTDKKKLRLYDVKSGDSVLRLLKKIAVPFMNNPVIMMDRNHSLWMKVAKEPGILYYPDILEKNRRGGWYHLALPAVINSPFIDRNNNLWLSAPNNALYFLSERHLKNLILTNHFPFPDKIPKAICGDPSGRLYISYINDKRIACINGRHTKKILLDQSFNEGSKHILLIKNRYLLFFDEAATLFDLEQNSVKNIAISNSIKSACLMGENDMLLASIRGVYLVENIFDRKVAQDNNVDDKGLIFKKRATAVGVLNHKQILIGTPAGLWIKQDIHAPEVKVNDSVLAASNIVDIKSIGEGSALVATNAKGLFVVQNGGNRIRPINISHDIGQLRRIYMQNDSTCWLATDNGAYVLKMDKNWSVRSVVNYNFYDGLPSNSVTDICVLRDTAYFTTMQGMGIIPLKDSSWQQMAPPVIFINSMQVDTTVIFEPDSAVVLKNNQNNILLSLSAISYESLGNINYYYKLSPIHDKWVQTTNPDIRFTELPPGAYTFTAYATNAKGTKSEHLVELRINIRPAFWQTLYFKITLFVLGVLALLFIYRRWLMRVEKKKYIALQQKKHLAELELEAIKAQINPHFIYNCLNSVKYLNYTGEYTQSQEYLNIFAKLIRMTMQYSRQTFISLSEESDYLSSYLKLEKLRFKDKLRYSLSMENNIDKDTQIPAMLLQPYIENALKHGIAGNKEGGEVQVVFEKKDGDLNIFIMDNGPGFPGVNPAGTLGMHLAGGRALSYNELFNLDIRVEYYNEQDHTPLKTGAVVKIIIRITDYGNIINQSSYYR